jgi:hypothetical protein
MDNSPCTCGTWADSVREGEAGGVAEQTAERNVWKYGRSKGDRCVMRYFTTCKYSSSVTVSVGRSHGDVLLGRPKDTEDVNNIRDMNIWIGLKWLR